jgi:hypothetical protein
MTKSKKKAKSSLATVAEINAAAGAAGYPFTAITNKPTSLIQLGDPSKPLPKGQTLIVHDEDGGFGTVATTINGVFETGTVLKSDYDPVDV